MSLSFPLLKMGVSRAVSESFNFIFLKETRRITRFTSCTCYGCRPDKASVDGRGIFQTVL
jgi:hypothetical protein